MGIEQIRAAADALTPAEKTQAVVEMTQSLSVEQQKEVVAKGIDPGAWPQNSRDRVVTILGSLVIASLVLVLGVWASTFAAAATIVTAAPLLASAIVGGIFGFSQASK